MGFFADRPRPVIVDRDDDVTIVVESMSHGRRRVLPGQIVARVVVFRTDDVVLLFDHFEVYPDGVRFRANLQLRESDARIDDLVFHTSYWWAQNEAPPEGFLRLGVVFSDGATWSNIDFVPFGDEPPPGPTLEFLDGGGGGGTWSMNVWLSPIPPEGPVTFVAEWPAHGIDEVQVTMDGGALRRAVELVEDLWPPATTS